MQIKICIITFVVTFNTEWWGHCPLIHPISMAQVQVFPLVVLSPNRCGWAFDGGLRWRRRCNYNVFHQIATDFTVLDIM